MKRVLEVLFDGAIDLEPIGTWSPDLLRAYIDGLGGPNEPQMGRLVCRSTDLRFLADALNRHRPSEAISLSILGRKGADRSTWEEALIHDAEAMNAFMEEADGLAIIDAYEVVCPSAEMLDECLDDLRGFDSADLFVEVPLDTHLHDAIAIAAQRGIAGLKGGLTGATGVATLIHDSLGLECDFKLAGAITGPYTTASSSTPGAINLLGGAALCLAEDLSIAQLATVLLAPSSDWRIESQKIQCGEFTATADQCDAVREFLISIGAPDWRPLLAGLGK